MHCTHKYKVVWSQKREIPPSNTQQHFQINNSTQYWSLMQFNANNLAVIFSVLFFVFYFLELNFIWIINKMYCLKWRRVCKWNAIQINDDNATEPRNEKKNAWYEIKNWNLTKNYKKLKKKNTNHPHVCKLVGNTANILFTVNKYK